MFRESAAWLQEGKYDKEKVYQHAVVAMNQRDAGVAMGGWLVQFIQEFKFPESRLAVPALAIFRENPNDERAIMQLLRDAVNRNDTDQLDTICQRGRNCTLTMSCSTILGQSLLTTERTMPVRWRFSKME